MTFESDPKRDNPSAPPVELIDLTPPQPKALYVDVALGVPQVEPYQYVVPESLRQKVAIGQRVKVPLRNQTRFGYIVGCSSQPKVQAPRAIEFILDEAPLTQDSLLQLTRWLGDYYFCSWGQAL